MNVLDQSSVQNVVSEFEPETIVHLAAITKRPSGETETLRMKEVNAIGARNIALASGGAHVILTSSCHVYGEPQELPIREDHPLLGNGVYALSKIEAERAMAEHAQSRLTVLRVFNLLGPGQDPSFALAGWCKSACESALDHKNEKPKNVKVGDLKLERDYLDVRDAAEAIVKVVEAGAYTAGKTYNICSGQWSSLADLFSLCAPNAKPERCDDRFRKGDVPRIVGCNSEIKSLGWNPSYSLRRTIMDMKRNYRDELEGLL